MEPTPEKTVGSVCLVGAGPGDPGLITARGSELLSAADAVVYDALVNPELLELAKPTARLILAGKRGGQAGTSQDSINQLLADLAGEVGLVVRLKGGDPYLFGRGAEEVGFLALRGISCEVVPGITAGVAAPAAAGIPVTHRHIASTVTFVTGHEDPVKAKSSVDYASLAGLIKAGGTACLYMGVRTLSSITEELKRHGLDGGTPVAAVQWGTLPRQRSARSSLDLAVSDFEEAKIQAPAIIVIGQVAAIEEPGLDYFTQRPLFGQRVVVTRTRQQASELRARLNSLGAETLEAPTIEINPPIDWSDIDEAIREIGQNDWLILTSVNGVAAVRNRMDELGLDGRHLVKTSTGEPVKVAVIGEATAAAVRDQLGVWADLVPPRYVAESLAEELIKHHDIRGRRVLLLRADIARPVLPRTLRDAGADVRELKIYEIGRTESLPEAVEQALREGTVDWITFTSSATARNMIDLLGGETDRLRSSRIASIGPITSATLNELGLPPTVEAEVSTIPGLVDAIVGYTSAGSPILSQAGMA